MANLDGEFECDDNDVREGGWSSLLKCVEF